MIYRVLLQLHKFGHPDSTLSLIDRTGRHDDASVGCDSMNKLDIQLGFFGPGRHIAIFGVGGGCSQWGNNLDLNRWQAKLLAKYVHILLQCWAAIRNDIDDGLPLAGKALLCQRLYVVSHAQVAGGIAIFVLNESARACLGGEGGRWRWGWR